MSTRVKLVRRLIEQSSSNYLGFGKSRKVHSQVRADGGGKVRVSDTKIREERLHKERSMGCERGM